MKTYTIVTGEKGGYNTYEFLLCLPDGGIAAGIKKGSGNIHYVESNLRILRLTNKQVDRILKREVNELQLNGSN